MRNGISTTEAVEQGCSDTRMQNVTARYILQRGILYYMKPKLQEKLCLVSFVYMEERSSKGKVETGK